MRRIALLFAVVFCFVPVLKADTTFDVFGATNTGECTAMHFACTPMSYTMVLTTAPGYQPMGFGNVDTILSMTGTLNGQQMTGSGGFLVPTVPNGPIPLSNGDFGYTLANGQQGTIYWDDIIYGSAIFTGATSSLVTWNISQVVATPEPSVLVLLIVGLIGCAAVLVARSRFTA